MEPSSLQPRVRRQGRPRSHSHKVGRQPHPTTVIPGLTRDLSPATAVSQVRTVLSETGIDADVRPIAMDMESVFAHLAEEVPA